MGSIPKAVLVWALCWNRSFGPWPWRLLSDARPCTWQWRDIKQMIIFVPSCGLFFDCEDNCAHVRLRYLHQFVLECDGFHIGPGKSGHPGFWAWGSGRAPLASSSGAWERWALGRGVEGGRFGIFVRRWLLLPCRPAAVDRHDVSGDMRGTHPSTERLPPLQSPPARTTGPAEPPTTSPPRRRAGAPSSSDQPRVCGPSPAPRHSLGFPGLCIRALLTW